jgi:transposase
MDNLKTHSTPEVQKWFDKHHRWIIHFTPTHASWLNQVELWFSILVRKKLKKGVFNSQKELIDALMDFIEKYNRTGKPFKWTYKGTPLLI